MDASAGLQVCQAYDSITGVENARTGVQKRIVEAAISCIEKDGLAGATIRGIARKAGVNSAAISYYFRSKEALMKEALATSLENAFGDWEVLLRQRVPDSKTRVRSVLLEVLEGSLKFPGIVKAHLYDTFINGTSRTMFITRFAKFLAALTRERGGLFPDRSVRQIGSDVVQMVSAVLLPGILPQLFRRAAGVDLTRADTRAAFVDSLIERFFQES